jgi:hypothetical protein
MLTSEAAMTGAAEGGTEVTVLPLGPTLRRIELRGSLPAGWAGRLAAGLAAQRISVVRGWASEGGDARWEAQLEVELPRYTIDLTPAAVLQLALPDAAPGRSGLDGLELLDFRLELDGDQVVVELEAADARGFLDRVLRLFAFHGLFPREMRVETTDGLVHDVFRLSGVHGGAPERATVDALDAKLRRVTVP